ncbi:signal transduction histidine kinase [Runella defluvii]|uniref:histidine kinase n=1 Tax=Runella defluvii TaxID=370973 RepID=A0A7W5ZSD2_9BACT|nr:HAMP domain-containing sensor histidine kinase [Runella defluvii]MBB3842259.1 signal transduction histidine kinase [Runella defluvii]
MKTLYYMLTVLALWIGQASLAIAQKPTPIDSELLKRKANLVAAKHDTTRMLALMDIANYYKNIRLQPDSGLVYALKAEQIANQYPNYAKTIKVFNTIGATYFLLRNNTVDITLKKKYPKLARQYFKKSLDLARKFKNEEYVIKSWYNIVENLRFFSKYPYFKSSFELIHYIQKKPQLTGLDSLVLRLTCKKVCYDLDYEMGSKQYNTYFALFKNFTPKKSNDYNELCILTFDQQVVLGKKSDEQHILKQYAAYQQVFKVLEHKDELNLSLVQYYFAIQDYKKSYQMCADFAPQKYGNANTKFAFLGFKYMLMGKNSYMLNRNQETIRHLQKAITFFNIVLNEYGLENEKYTALIYLSKAYKKAGNYKQALSCNEQADVLYKQMHDVGKQALMAENDVQLEQIKQDKKVQAAQTQALLKEQEAQIEKRQKYVFALLALIAFISTGWAFYNFHKTRQQNAIISQQAAALEETNHLKDKIFALLSHDLRSPINRLIISLNHSIESQRSTIQSELKGVQDILNNVLYWASMQLKGSTPVYTAVPLRPLAESLMSEYEHNLNEKNITFLNAIDAQCELKTDENYLKIILRNLLTNAIKFTAENGFIQLDCQIKDKVAQIIVRDTGIGIAPDKLQQVFYYPTPNAGTKKEKGTGLGLGLSLDIAKKLGGDIQLKSQVGKGTQVMVCLPAA